MRSSYDFTRKSMDALPEALWQPVHHRIRSDATIWQALLATPDTYEAVFKDANTLAEWTSGELTQRWAVALLSVKRGSKKWFEGKHGRALQSESLTALIKGRVLTSEQISPYFHKLSPAGRTLLTAFFAALQLKKLRGKWTSNQMWSKALSYHHAHPLAWKTTASILYSFLPDNSKFVWELTSLDDAAALALMAHAMLMNEDAEALARLQQSLQEVIPGRAQRLLSQYIADPVTAYASHSSTKSVSVTEQLLTSLTHALDKNSDQGADAVDNLVNAIEDAQKITALITANLGYALLRSNEAQAAEQAFAQSLEWEKNERATIGLAQCHLATDEPNLAINMLRDCDTSKPDVLVTLARANLASGNRLHAAELIRETANNGNLDTCSVHDKFEMATLLSDANDYAGALQFLEQCLAQDPTNQQYYQLESQLHLQLGANEAAIASATEGVVIDPKQAQSHITLAKTLQTAGQHSQQNYTAALQAWERAKNLDAENLDIAFGYVHCALDAKKPQLAQVTIEDTIAMLQTAPTIALDALGEANTLLGRALQAQGEFEAAHQKYQEATELAPENAQPWRAVANYHALQGNTSQAIKLLERGRQSVGQADRLQGAYLCVDLGDLHAKENSITEAISAYRDAINLVPDSGNYVYKLADLLYQQGHTAEAAFEFERAADLDAANPQIWRMLGILREELGRPEPALQAYHQAAVLGIDNQPLLTKLIDLAHQLKQPAIVAEFLPKLVEQQDPTPHQLSMLGSAYEATADYDAAFGIYRQAHALFNDADEWVLRQAQCMIRADKAHVARTLIDEAQSQFTETWRADEVLGDAYSELSLWPDAMAAYDRVRLHVKENMGILRKYLDAAQSAGRADNAIDALQEMAQLHPLSPTIQLEMGKLYYNTNRGHLALGCFQKALELNPGDQETLLTLSNFLQAMDQFDAAIAMLTEALTLNPEAPIELRIELAEAYRNANQLELAYDTFKLAADQLFVERQNEASDLQANCLQQAADCIYSLGQTSAAIETWRSALQIDPSNLDIIEGLSNALIQNERPAEAISILEPILKSVANNPALYDYAAQASLDLGKPSSAKIYLDHNIDQNQATATTYALLGKSLFRNNKFKAAKDAYEQAHRLESNNAVNTLGLSKALVKLGEAQPAKHLLEGLLNSSTNLPIQQLTDIAQTLSDAGYFNQALTLLLSKNSSVQGSKDVVEALTVIALDYLQFMHVSKLFEQHSLEVVKKPMRAREVRKIATQSFSNYRLQTTTAETNNVNMLRVRLQTLLADQLTPIENLMPMHRLERSSHVLIDSALLALRTNQLNLAKQYADLAILWGHRALGNDLQMLLELALFDVNTSPKTAEPDETQHSARMYYILGRRAQDRERLLEAEQFFEAALAADTQQALWQARLATIYTAHHKDEAALTASQAAVQLGRKYHLSSDKVAELLAKLAQCQIADSDTQNAVQNLEKAIRLHKKAPAAWQTMLGELYLKTEKYQAAIREFTSAAKKAPNDTGPLLGISRAYAEQGNTDMSEALAKEAVRKDPKNAEAWTLLGFTRAQNGKPVEADDAFIKAREVADDPIPAMLAHAKVLRDAQLYQDALGLATEVLEIDGLRASAWALRGQMLAKLQKAEQAIAAYEKARELEPGHSAYARAQAELYRDAGHLDKALECFDRALQLQHSNRARAEIFDELAKTLKQRREYERALDAWQKAMEIDTRESEYPYRMGELLFHQFQDVNSARSLLNQAMQLSPNRVEIRHLLDAIKARGMYENGADLVQ